MSCNGDLSFLKENLKKLRHDKGMTQSEVCDEVRNIGFYINRSTYAKYETGDRIPPAKVLIALAICFDTTTDYILGLSDNPKFN